jgi:uncharacterized protein (TIGR01777 family)
LRIAVAGGSGWIGHALCRALSVDGHDVAVLTRDVHTSIPSGSRRVVWDARLPGDWVSEVGSADAVVNLAGAAVAPRRWTAHRRAVLRTSRIEPTAALVAAMRQAARPPAVFVSTSAVGYYGDRGDEPVAEADPPGQDFLAELACEWEAAAQQAERSGVRVVTPRVGVVVGTHGGALRFLALPFRFRVGGPLGTGQQWVPWVHLEDVVGAYRFAIGNPELRGAVNVTAPGIVTNAEMSRGLAAVFGGKSWLPVPGWVLKLALGELAVTVLGGQKALPAVLQRLGYQFSQSALLPALQKSLTPGLRT